MKDLIVLVWVLSVLAALFVLCFQTLRNPEANRLTRFVVSFYSKHRAGQLPLGLRGTLVFLMVLFVLLAVFNLALFFGYIGKA